MPVRIGKSYYRCDLKDTEWRRLVAADEVKPMAKRAIYRLWPDFPVAPCTDRSAMTIKSDASLRSFDAAGDDITWAVVDSGVQADHPHFGDVSTAEGRQAHLLLSDTVRDLHRNFADIFEMKGALLVQAKPLENPDWTPGMDPEARAALIEQHRVLALTDAYGHGTHVAGIIAGRAPAPDRVHLRVIEHQYTINPDGQKVSSTFAERSLRSKAELRGMAPLCKLISLRVLDHRGQGRSSQVIEALEYLREKINDNPKLMRVHGVNLSVGYPFDPEMFACGQSPLCATVNRLVQEGVVVVTAAGNTGYGSAASSVGTAQIGLSNTINDPGNADLAITVGSTHREAPFTYGVSYFSSKGPTADGRLKPDLVAPGERITSCAAGKKLQEAKVTKAGTACYVDDTGTSMAAPHVSGAVAAFLSIRREFIGRPLDVKRIFLESATPLGRERYFEGHGLVDLMRAIQSV
jgi:subtilisin family serine protease